MPELYIITGSNGAGKSTVGHIYLPKRIRDKYTIFNGDNLFAEKRKQIYKKITPSLKEAERLAQEWLYKEFKNRVADAIKKKDHFVYEGHLPEKENWVTPKKFRKEGYKINLIFLGLSDPTISALRVLHRARKGGHNVPPYEIQRNFYGNLKRLNTQYKLIDELQIVDTSETATHKVLAIFNKGEVVSADPVLKLPDWFERGLPKLYKKIFDKQKPLKPRL